MRNTRTYRLVTAEFTWVLPIAVIPAVCFAIGQACFLWSLIALGITAFRVWNHSGTRRGSAELPDQTVSLIRAGIRLAAITSVVQMLGLLWLGTVRALQGVAHLILLWDPAGHALGWIQSHWCSSALFWFLLFAIVCGLFRLGRPVLEWHREAVNSLADAIRQRRKLAPEAEDI